uniref:Uncharacterized protein n=1 Tax=Steinernema glaseri TaxID=37863 RepID=A0A1I7ZSG5_9BILA
MANLVQKTDKRLKGIDEDARTVNTQKFVGRTNPDDTFILCWTTSQVTKELKFICCFYTFDRAPTIGPSSTQQGVVFLLKLLYR